METDEKDFIIDNWQYYGVFLDDKSKSIIDREFRDLIPSNWKKYMDHITVQYNDYSQDTISKGRALSSKLGYEYSAQIVAVGKTDTAIALKVDGIETANKIAHITLAVSPEGKPVDSNKITEWNPVGPIEINGALGLSYKGKKYFHVLDDNEVVDFQIDKHSLNQQETNMNNINLSDLDRHGIEHFQFEHIIPSRVLRGTNDHGVPIHASSKMCDDAGIIGNYNRMGIPVVAIKGKESLSVPPGGVYLVEEGKSNYKLLSKEAFDKRFTMVEVLRENGENTLVCVRAGTKLNFAQTGANRQMFPEHVKDTKIDTLTRDAILAHIDKITALYPQYPQDPTKVSLKPDGSIVRQYGEFEYEQIKGGFERSKNLVLVEELDGEPLQRKALYSMSSDSYGEHPNGPYVRFWDNGNIRYYENRSVRVGSDNEFESDMIFFTREGIVQEKIPGDYSIEPFLEDLTNEYMKTMTQKEGLEPNATANKLAAMAGLSPKELRREDLRRKAEKSFNRQIGTLGSSSNNNLLNNGQKRR